MEKPIDLVVPYVNSSDPGWIKLHEETLKKIGEVPDSDTPNRYRDFGMFKYFFRCVSVNCPWIRKIWVVLQSPSQKPEWLEESGRVKCVYHKEFIPEKYLPTYNSATIELFVWRIRGLSENFIYANDDMYVMKTLGVNDFFDSSWRPKISLEELPQYNKNNAVYHMIKNSEFLAIIASNGEEFDMDRILLDGHSWTPMKRSVWRKLFEKVGEGINGSVTQFRSLSNVVQQLSTIYLYYTKKYASRTLHPATIQYNGENKQRLLDTLHSNIFDIITINDIAGGDYIQNMIWLCTLFDQMYPNKSIYEKRS